MENTRLPSRWYLNAVGTQVDLVLEAPVEQLLDVAVCLCQQVQLRSEFVEFRGVHESRQRFHERQAVGKQKLLERLKEGQREAGGIGLHDRRRCAGFACHLSCAESVTQNSKKKKMQKQIRDASPQ